jgi:hypothetical protein
MVRVSVLLVGLVLAKAPWISSVNRKERLRVWAWVHLTDPVLALVVISGAALEVASFLCFSWPVELDPELAMVWPVDQALRGWVQMGLAFWEQVC